MNLTQRIHSGDSMRPPQGRYAAEVYLGDVKRAPLSVVHIEENLHEVWKMKLLRGYLPSRWHRGEVLNQKVDEFAKDNLVVTVGKELILDRLYGLSSWAALTQMGVGTSATAAAIGNTDLTGGVWKNFDATPTRSALTVTSVTTFGTGEANINWQEMGQRTVSTSNKLLSRVAPIGPFNKTAAVSIVLTYALTQA